MTFSGNALCCAGALANIDIMTDPRYELMKRADAMGAKMKEQLRAFGETSPVIGEVRGKGLMVGCELVKNRETREPIDGDLGSEISLTLMNRGAIAMNSGRYRNVFRFMPPLVTPAAYLQKAIDIFCSILKERERDLTG